ncbi:MAG: amidohydrolase [Candidatus Tectomicrobia bacterium]|nr:amidohydrolase [Candidatus Tectomicrobia bacterium]
MASAPLLLEGGTVLTLDPQRRRFEEGWVSVEGGRIASLGAGPPPSLPPGAQRFSLRGRTLMPGLVNCHAHLFLSLLRGAFSGLPLYDWLKRIYSVVSFLTEEDCRAAARLGCLELAHSGVTTFVDHHFLNPRPGLGRTVLEAYRGMGLRGIFSRGLMDMGTLCPPEGLEQAERVIEECRDLLREFREPLVRKEVGLCIGPNSPGYNVTSDSLRKASAFAREAGLQVTVHVAETRRVVEDVRRLYGYAGVVEYLEGIGVLGPEILAAHAIHISPGEIDLLASRGAAVAYNPVANMYLGDGVAPVVDLLRAGVKVGLGTDGAASNNTLDFFETMKFGSLLQKVQRLDPGQLPAGDTLHMATLGGARCLGLDEEIGSIETGKRADLIVVRPRGRPHTTPLHDLEAQLVYSAKCLDMESVLVDGRFVVKEGKLLTASEEDILQEAEASGERIRRGLRRIWRAARG